MTNQLTILAQREYWEHKKSFLYLPLGLAAFLTLGLMLSLAFKPSPDFNVNVDIKMEKDAKTLNFAVGATRVDPSTLNSESQEMPSKGDKTNVEANAQATSERAGTERAAHNIADIAYIFEFGVFYIIMLITGVFYLLGTLHNDRKDKSILFWKSHPLSDVKSVLVKFTFGTFGFLFVAVLASWLAFFVQWVFGLTAAIDVDHDAYAGNSIDLVFILFSPIALVITTVLWSAPLFGYILLISAVSKRAPFLMLVIPVLGLIFIERIILGSHTIAGIIAERSPFAVLRSLQNGDSIITTTAAHVSTHVTSLLSGFILCALFLAAAIWCRKYRFEI